MTEGGSQPRNSTTVKIIDSVSSVSPKEKEVKDLQNITPITSKTKTAAGWVFEKLVHDRLGVGEATLTIFNSTDRRDIQSSSHFLPGTLAGLKEVGTSKSFYWIPSVANFPGIDSVLGNGAHIYTIQATITDEHKSPEDGIKKVWGQLLPQIRTSCTWHFVVMTNSTQTAERYETKFTTDLAQFRLGRDTTVRVWAGVLTK